MVKYVFRDEIVPIRNAKNANPQKIGEAIQAVANKNGGRLIPESVEEAARPKNHPLHPFFEWDDSIAARAYRVDQARHLIRLVRVEDDTAEEHPHAFISLNDGGGICYRSLGDVQRSANLQLAVMKAARRDLEAFQRRYRSLSEVCSDVSAAISKIDARIEGESRAAAA
jgi:hypothetical protein